MTKPTLAFLRRMVGNPRVYAVQHEDGSYHPVKEPLTPKVLKQHMAGDITVGTYVNKSDKAKFLCFDIDDDDLNAVAAIEGALHGLGFAERCTGVEFSGRKGYHVWVVFTAYVDAAELRHIGKAVLAVAQVECEVFPKQDVARDLGNLVKLPGGVHRVTGNRNDFRGPLPTPCAPAVVKRVLAKLPEAPKVSAYEGDGGSEYECLEKIQAAELADGDGRNNALFQVAVLNRKNGYDAENNELVVRNINENRFAEPLPDHEVNALLRSSAHSGPICAQLSDDLRCEDCPFKRRKDKLWTKRGQLRHGAAGDPVVVRIKKTKGSTIYFEHEDLTQGKGALR